MNEEYFFAPREKLSQGLHLIRSVALCAMVVLAFFGTVGSINVFRQIALTQAVSGMADDPSSLLMSYLSEVWAALLIETVVLVLLWRVSCLRRWACAFCCAGAWLVWIQQLHDRAQDVDGSYWIAMFSFCAVLISFTALLRREWPNLKTRF